MISSIRYLLKNLPLKGRVREGANLKRIFGYYKMSSYFAIALDHKNRATGETDSRKLVFLFGGGEIKNTATHRLSGSV